MGQGTCRGRAFRPSPPIVAPVPRLDPRGVLVRGVCSRRALPVRLCAWAGLCVWERGVSAGRAVREQTPSLKPRSARGEGARRRAPPHPKRAWLCFREDVLLAYLFPNTRAEGGGGGSGEGNCLVVEVAAVVVGVIPVRRRGRKGGWRRGCGPAPRAPGRRPVWGRREVEGGEWYQNFES